MALAYLILLGAAAAGAPESPIRQRATAPAANPKDASMTTAGNQGKAAGIARLPFAQGHSFATLDAYLKHLERQGAIGLPWWRETGPGVYEHVIQMRDAKPDTATRAELLERFGFER